MPLPYETSRPSHTPRVRLRAFEGLRIASRTHLAFQHIAPSDNEFAPSACSNVDLEDMALLGDPITRAKCF